MAARKKTTTAEAETAETKVDEAVTAETGASEETASDQEGSKEAESEENIVAAVVIRPFKDKYTGAYYKKGAAIRVSEKRLAEINSAKTFVKARK